MFSFILYAIISFVAAFILTMAAVVIRPLKARDEFRPGRVLVTFLIITLIIPYLYVEVVSRVFGPSMKTAAEDAFESAKISGDLLYYKVRWYWGDKATVYVVGREKQSWGGFDRPIIEAKLEKTPKGWSVASYKFVQSDRQNIDHVTYPPYW